MCRLATDERSRSPERLFAMLGLGVRHASESAFAMKRNMHLHTQPPILLRVRRLGALEPGVVSAAATLEDATLRGVLAFRDAGALNQLRRLPVQGTTRMPLSADAR
jgi:hypothetical protein